VIAHAGCVTRLIPEFFHYCYCLTGGHVVICFSLRRLGGPLYEGNLMLSALSATVDRYFDLAEHLILRAALLLFFLLPLYRLIKRELKK
jgi:hypothetical protein